MTSLLKHPFIKNGLVIILILCSCLVTAQAGPLSLSASVGTTTTFEGLIRNERSVLPFEWSGLAIEAMNEALFDEVFTAELPYTLTETVMSESIIKSVIQFDGNQFLFNFPCIITIEFSTDYKAFEVKLGTTLADISKDLKACDASLSEDDFASITQDIISLLFLDKALISLDRLAVMQTPLQVGASYTYLLDSGIRVNSIYTGEADGFHEFMVSTYIPFSPATLREVSYDSVTFNYLSSDAPAMIKNTIRMTNVGLLHSVSSAKTTKQFTYIYLIFEDSPDREEEGFVIMDILESVELSSVLP